MEATSVTPASPPTYGDRVSNECTSLPHGLNTSFGIDYPYTTTEIHALWTAAANTNTRGAFLNLASQLGRFAFRSPARYIPGSYRVC